MHLTKLTCATSLALALTACGGGGSTSAPSTPNPPPTYQVTATISGLTGSGLVLTTNTGDTTPALQANGNVNFPGFANGASYVVTVMNQPPQESCTVSNGSGTISGANVTNVAVNCVVVPPSPSLSLLAGNMNGPGNIDGPAASATFNRPTGVGTDGAGNVFVADAGNGTIRKIAATGAVSTIGSFTGLYLGTPNSNSIAADGEGNFFFSFPTCSGSSYNLYNVFKINSAGAMPVTNAGCLAEGAIAVDSAGNVYINGPNSVTKIAPTGTSTAIGSFAFVGYPYYAIAMTVDSAGNIYGAGHGLVQKLTPGGVLTTLAGTAGANVSADGAGAAATFAYLAGITVEGNGTLYVLDGNTIRKITPTGVVTTLAGTLIMTGNPQYGLNTTVGVTGSTNGIGAAASFNAPQGIAVDNQGNIYVADTGNSAIRKITAAGAVTTLAGGLPVVGSSDGLGAAASFNGPLGIATDAAGNAYVADGGNFTIRKITPGGLTSTLAGSPGLKGYVDGIGAAARFGNTSLVPANGSYVTLAPQGVATDSAGNVYVADSGNLNIREISPAGVVTTFAGPGASGSLGSAVFSTEYSSCNGSTSHNCVGTLGPTVGPYGVAVNSMGNIYVADTSLGAISTITPAGVVTAHGDTIDSSAAALSQPLAVVADNAGNVYVTFSYSLSITKMTPSGVVSTFAGGASAGSADGVGAAASFRGASGMAIDSSGNLYVADTGNCTIRKITPAAVVSTVVGVAGQCGFVAGALPAHLSSPNNVAISGRTLYITTANGVAVVNDVP